MLRYLRLFAVQLRMSSLATVQYRLDFFVDGVLEVFWAATALVPLFVVYGVRDEVAGWSFGEALLVVGWFTLLQGVIEGAINPSLSAVVEHIRKGTLDFVLLKPADSQFLVSTAKFQPWQAVNAVTAGGIFAYGFVLLGHGPSPAGVAVALVMLAAAVLLLYSFWILTVSAAFIVVKIDNLTYLFNSIFDAARWPSSIFRGALGFVLTFVVPLAVMTTFPALALLDRLPLGTLAASVGGSIAFAALARFTWLRAIARYTSAGG